MKTFECVIQAEDGLHARPAGLLVQTAKQCASSITVSKGSHSADAKRLFAVMGLGVKKDDRVSFKIEGKSEENDCEKMKLFCSKSL